MKAVTGPGIYNQVREANSSRTVIISVGENTKDSESTLVAFLYSLFVP